MTVASAVLDASALLAYLFDEPGGDQVIRLAGAQPVMSAVNWSEVSQKAVQHGVDHAAVREAATGAGLDIVDFTVDRAESAAQLWSATKGAGLSLADRACLVLAVEFDRAAVTADQRWSELSVKGLRVRCLR